MMALDFSEREQRILAEMRTMVRLESDRDLIRCALWMYAQHLRVKVEARDFAVGAVGEARTRTPRHRSATHA